MNPIVDVATIKAAIELEFKSDGMCCDGASISVGRSFLLAKKRMMPAILRPKFAKEDAVKLARRVMMNLLIMVETQHKSKKRNSMLGSNASGNDLYGHAVVINTAGRLSLFDSGLRGV